MPELPSSPLRVLQPAAAFYTPPTMPAPIDAPGAPERVAGVNHRHRHAIPFTLDNDDFETCEYSRDVPISSDFLERLAEFDY